jgi:hypothetical protein
MTFKPHASRRLWIAALAVGLSPLASAWQVAPAPPRPVVIVQPPANVRFQQTMRDQQVRDQAQKNQVEEQLRQARSDMARQPFATDPVRAVRLDQADQAQRDLYRARQQDLLDRYQSAVAPPVVHPQNVPASSRSSG